jgi:hypothetical protein
MRKLFFACLIVPAILTVISMSCVAKDPPSAYNVGQIVYLKPDSTKAVVTRTFGQCIYVSYVDSLKVIHEIDIYPKQIYP